MSDFPFRWGTRSATSDDLGNILWLLGIETERIPRSVAKRRRLIQTRLLVLVMQPELVCAIRARLDALADDTPSKPRPKPLTRRNDLVGAVMAGGDDIRPHLDRALDKLGDDPQGELTRTEFFAALRAGLLRQVGVRDNRFIYELTHAGRILLERKLTEAP